MLKKVKPGGNVVEGLLQGFHSHSHTQSHSLAALKRGTTWKEKKLKEEHSPVREETLKMKSENMKNMQSAKMFADNFCSL